MRAGRLPDSLCGNDPGAGPRGSGAMAVGKTRGGSLKAWCCGAVEFWG